MSTRRKDWGALGHECGAAARDDAEADDRGDQRLRARRRLRARARLRPALRVVDARSSASPRSTSGSSPAGAARSASRARRPRRREGADLHRPDRGRRGGAPHRSRQRRARSRAREGARGRRRCSPRRARSRWPLPRRATNLALQGDHDANLEREGADFGELFASEERRRASRPSPRSGTGLQALSALRSRKREPTFGPLADERDERRAQRQVVAALRLQRRRRGRRPDLDLLLRLGRGRSAGVPGAPGFGTRCTVASAGTVTHQPALELRLVLAHRPSAHRRRASPATASSVTETTVPRSSSVNGMPARRREQQVRRPLQPRVRIDRRAAARVQLEVQVRVDSVRVARVAHVADRLAGHAPSRRSSAPSRTRSPRRTCRGCRSSA